MPPQHQAQRAAKQRTIPARGRGKAAHARRTQAGRSSCHGSIVHDAPHRYRHRIGSGA